MLMDIALYHDYFALDEGDERKCSFGSSWYWGIDALGDDLVLRNQSHFF